MRIGGGQARSRSCSRATYMTFLSLLMFVHAHAKTSTAAQANVPPHPLFVYLASLFVNTNTDAQVTVPPTHFFVQLDCGHQIADRV